MSMCSIDVLLCSDVKRIDPASSVISQSQRQRWERMLLLILTTSRFTTSRSYILLPERFKTLSDRFRYSPKATPSKLIFVIEQSTKASFSRLRDFSIKFCSQTTSQFRAILFKVSCLRSWQFVVIRQSSNRQQGIGLPVMSSFWRVLSVQRRKFGFFSPFQLRFSSVRFLLMPDTPVFFERSSLWRDFDFFADSKIVESGLICTFDSQRAYRVYDCSISLQSSQQRVKLFLSLISGEDIDSLLIGVSKSIVKSRQRSSFFIPQFFNINSCNLFDCLILSISLVLMIFLDRSTTRYSGSISLTTTKQFPTMPSPLRSTRSARNSPFLEFFNKKVFKNSCHPISLSLIFISIMRASYSLLASYSILRLFYSLTQVSRRLGDFRGEDGSWRLWVLCESFWGWGYWEVLGFRVRVRVRFGVGVDGGCLANDDLFVRDKFQLISEMESIL